MMVYQPRDAIARHRTRGDDVKGEVADKLEAGSRARNNQSTINVSSDGSTVDVARKGRLTSKIIRVGVSG